MESRPLYVTPDTNFLLHGKPLEEVTPSILGLDRPFSWLLVDSVVDELDEKTHHTNNRIKRRARSALSRLEDQEGPASSSAVVEFFKPAVPIRYADEGFDPAKNDDIIQAEVMTFGRERPEADVVLLTLDIGMRLKARRRGIRLAVPTVDIQAAEEVDEVERENRHLRARVAEFENAHPNLDLVFLDGSNEIECQVFPTLSPDAVERIAATVGKPERDLDAVNFMGGIWRDDPRYDEKLASYVDKVRLALPDLWRRHGALVHLAFKLTNDADVEATNVRADLKLPPFVRAPERRPEKPGLPRKPSRIVLAGNPNAPWRLAAALSAASPPKFTLPYLTTAQPVQITSWGPSLRVTGLVSYGEPMVRQRRSVTLDAVTLEIHQIPPAFSIGYEIRASNGMGVKTGSLLVRLRQTSLDEAIGEMLSELLPTDEIAKEMLPNEAGDDEEAQ